MLIYLLRRQSSRPVPARGLRVIKGLAYRDSSEGKLLAAQGKALEAQGKLLGALHADGTDVKADVVGVKVDMTGVKATLQEQGTQLKEVSGKLARGEKDIQLVL